MKLKKTMILAVAFLMVLAVFACKGTTQPTGTPAGNEQPSGTTQQNAGNENPAQTQQNEPTEEQSWFAQNLDDGSQTEEELYELAKAEGKVVIYSISSRMETAADSFKEKYPGIEVEVSNMKTDVVKEKVLTEYKAGVKNCDVVHVTDLDGALYTEYVAGGVMKSYYPTGILSKIDLSKYNLDTAFPLYYELTQWFYNFELCPDGVDVDSWWDLTRPEWKGKLLMNNLLTNQDYIAQFAAFAEYADELAADYEREFGEKITYTCGKENAGYELVYRLLNNDPIFTASSDEAIESVGADGVTEIKLAWGPSSKVRNNEKKGWHIAPLNMTPKVGVPKPNNLYVVNECLHPNAAKLFIRFICGGEDGTSPGFDPFNTLGGWPLRSDVTPAEGSIPLSEIPLWPNNPAFVYMEKPDMEDFIMNILG